MDEYCAMFKCVLDSCWVNECSEIQCMFQFDCDFCKYQSDCENEGIFEEYNKGITL